MIILASSILLLLECKFLSQFTFCNMIMAYRYLNPKHVIQRALKLPSISPTYIFDTTKLYKPLPLFAIFFIWAYEVAQSPQENSMSGTNTRSGLARFHELVGRRGRILEKLFTSKKLCMRWSGAWARVRAGWRVKRYDHVAKSESRQNFAKVAKILRLSQKYSKTNPAKL